MKFLLPTFPDHKKTLLSHYEEPRKNETIVLTPGLIRYFGNQVNLCKFSLRTKKWIKNPPRNLHCIALPLAVPFACVSFRLWWDVKDCNWINATAICLDDVLTQIKIRSLTFFFWNSLDPVCYLLSAYTSVYAKNFWRKISF